MRIRSAVPLFVMVVISMFGVAMAQEPYQLALTVTNGVAAVAADRYTGGNSQGCTIGLEATVTQGGIPAPNVMVDFFPAADEAIPPTFYIYDATSFTDGNGKAYARASSGIGGIVHVKVGTTASFDWDSGYGEESNPVTLTFSGGHFADHFESSGRASVSWTINDFGGTTVAYGEINGILGGGSSPHNVNLSGSINSLDVTGWVSTVGSPGRMSQASASGNGLLTVNHSARWVSDPLDANWPAPKGFFCKPYPSSATSHAVHPGPMDKSMGESSAVAGSNDIHAEAPRASTPQFDVTATGSIVIPVDFREAPCLFTYDLKALSMYTCAKSYGATRDAEAQSTHSASSLVWQHTHLIDGL